MKWEEEYALLIHKQSLSLNEDVDLTVEIEVKLRKLEKVHKIKKRWTVESPNCQQYLETATAKKRSVLLEELREEDANFQNRLSKRKKMKGKLAHVHVIILYLLII